VKINRHIIDTHSGGRSVLKRWITKQGPGLIDICFIPAGKEISIFGIAKNTKISKSLFRSIRHRCKMLLKKSHHYLGS